MKSVRVGIGVALGLCLFALRLEAERLEVRTIEDWREWEVPGDAVEISAEGVQPAYVRRDIDAVADAGKFLGGVWKVGTAAAQAEHLIDGDRATAWRPGSEAPVEDWWIEIDLGRVVSARKIRLLFDGEGPPLEFFQIYTSDGEPFFTNANTIIPGTVLYNKRWRFSYNEQGTVEIDYELNPLRYIRIQAERRTEGAGLSELQVETVGDNIALGILERKGTVGITSESVAEGELIVQPAAASLALIDGDLATFWGIVGLNADFSWFEFDLGGLFWVDRVRILGDPKGISPSGGYYRRRAMAANYLWYLLYGSDGSRAPDGSLRWEILGELPSDPHNLQEVIHFEECFPLQPLRYFKLVFPQEGTRPGTTAEFQIFGEGYPAEVVLQSPIYDLQGLKNIASVEWEAEVPAGCRLEIRTRTGNLLEEQIFFHDKGGKEVTEQRWNKLIPSFRGPVDTVRTIGADWSPWSRAYQVSGEHFLSPSPRRYAMVEARLTSEDPSRAVRLEEIDLDFYAPLARQTTGEIFPNRALPGEQTRFTYYLRSTMEGGDSGFDRLSLQSSAAMAFAELRVDGQVEEVELEEEGGELKLTLPEPVTRSSLIEIDFDSEIFLSQTRFNAFLSSSRFGDDIRQQVDPGDASEAVESGVNFVSLPVDEQLVSRLSLSPPVLTPNGDGIGDRLVVEFDLLKVLEPRPVEIALYDLSGRRVRLLLRDRGAAGRVRVEWDGRAESGERVLPGSYLLRIEVEGDENRGVVARPVSVAY